MRPNPRWSLPLAGALLAGAAICTAVLRGERQATAENRARVAQLSAAEKEELARRRDRFAQLPAEETARLRGLHGELAAAADGDELSAVLKRYHEWLATLEARERTELLSLSGDAKAAKVRELVAEQERQRFWRLAEGKLSNDDLQAILAWLDEMFRRRERELLNALPEDYRQRVAEMPPLERRRRLMYSAMSRRRPGAELPTPEPGEVAELLGRLSPQAQRLYAAAREPSDQSQLLQRWIRAAVFSRIAPPVSEEELLDFFANKVDPKTRGELEELPRDEMLREVQRLYHQQRFREGIGAPPADWREGPREGPREGGQREGGQRGRPGPPGPPAPGVGEPDERLAPPPGAPVGPPPGERGSGAPPAERRGPPAEGPSPSPPLSPGDAAPERRP